LLPVRLWLSAVVTSLTVSGWGCLPALVAVELVAWDAGLWAVVCLLVVCVLWLAMVTGGPTRAVERLRAEATTATRSDAGEEEEHEEEPDDDGC
jgi:hypothetical protein